MPKFFALIAACLLLAPSLKAEVWASASVPTGFRFSSEGGALYDFDQTASGGASGYSFLVGLPVSWLPALGISRFSVEAQPTDKALKDPNHFEAQSYDLAFDLSTKSAKFLLGYGAGKLRFLCSQSDCGSLEFNQRELQQYFAQIGVPLGSASDFHLDIRRVIGRVQVSDSAQSETLHLQGLLFAFGFRLGF